MSDTALALRAIDKRFGATTALVTASLTVRRGTLHAVLGENGAGKTTLMRIAFGMLRPDAGTVVIDDRPVSLSSGADAMQHGLGMVHQHFTLVPAMTAAENIALGGHGMFRAREVAARVRSLSERTGLAVDPDARVSSLGVGAQQRVEILKALAGNARTLILDEPTAVLTPGETEELFRWLRRFVADGGTVVLVTHKLQEALSIADDVTVLRRGANVLTAPAAGLEVDDLVRALTGEDRAGQPLRARAAAARGASVARLVDACARDARGVVRVQAATIECFAGEIVGIAGIEPMFACSPSRMSDPLPNLRSICSFVSSSTLSTCSRSMRLTPLPHRGRRFVEAALLVRTYTNTCSMSIDSRRVAVHPGEVRDGHLPVLRTRGVQRAREQRNGTD